MFNSILNFLALNGGKYFKFKNTKLKEVRSTKWEKNQHIIKKKSYLLFLIFCSKNVCFKYVEKNIFSTPSLLLNNYVK